MDKLDPFFPQAPAAKHICNASAAILPLLVLCRETGSDLPQKLCHCFSSTGTLLYLHEESKGLETIREKEIIVLRQALKYHCVDVLNRWGMRWPNSGSPG